MVDGCVVVIVVVVVVVVDWVRVTVGLGREYVMGGGLGAVDFEEEQVGGWKGIPYLWGTPHRV